MPKFVFMSAMEVNAVGSFVNSEDGFVHIGNDRPGSDIPIHWLRHNRRGNKALQWNKYLKISHRNRRGSVNIHEDIRERPRIFIGLSSCHEKKTFEHCWFIFNWHLVNIVKLNKLLNNKLKHVYLCRGQWKYGCQHVSNIFNGQLRGMWGVMTLEIHFVACTHVVKLAHVIMLILYKYLKRIFSRNAAQEKETN